MQISSKSFQDHGVMPERCAFGVIDLAEHVRLSDNCNPDLSWSDAPTGTKSFVLLCIDVDVPSKPDDVNQEGRTVPPELPRVEFCHWSMVDIPANVTSIAEGACSREIIAGGKTDPAGPKGSRQGQNDYTNWFAGDPDMGGTYLGYDGPCPPWNDSLVHHYQFTVYATDLESCPVEGDFTAADVLAAIEEHVLDKATITGRYRLNPEVEL